MKNKPKVGTIERMVVDLMIARKHGGICHFDFPGMTEQDLADIIVNLENGIFESENDDDSTIMFNS